MAQSTKLYDPADYHTDLMAGDVAALIAHLGLERADLMGYSLGGRISAVVAARASRAGALGHPRRRRHQAGRGRAACTTTWRAALEAALDRRRDRPAGQGVPPVRRADRDPTCKALAACLRGSRQTLRREELGARQRADAGRGRHQGRHRGIAGRSSRRCSRTAQALDIPTATTWSRSATSVFKAGALEFLKDRAVKHHAAVDRDASPARPATGWSPTCSATAGQPVLLLHGGGQTRHAWGRTAEHLARAGAHAYALDQRGHGDSEWVADGHYALRGFRRRCRGRRDDACANAAARGRSRSAPRSAAWRRCSPKAPRSAPGSGPLFAAIVLVDITPRVDQSGVAKIQGFMRERARGRLRHRRGGRRRGRRLPAASQAPALA